MHVGARPLTRTEWHDLLTDAGFTIRDEETCPLLFLDPRTVVSDEGQRGTATILSRALLHPNTLPRLVAIWKTFHRYRDHLGAITLTAPRQSCAPPTPDTANGWHPATGSRWWTTSTAYDARAGSVE